ncbi:DEAD/DEAH box helicase [Acetobacteraceae bacterium]|nr:DEAD/DEAH box helicase [Acetobacteraceae bacterium]
MTLKINKKNNSHTTTLSFKAFNLSPALTDALEKNKFEHPSNTQAELLPSLLKNHRALLQAPTGTGKTLTFLLPGIEHLLKFYTEDCHTYAEDAPLFLIVSPTRELVRQTGTTLKKLCKDLNLNVLISFAGSLAPKEFPISEADIIVATPGRILNLLEKGTISGSRLSFIVLDEADRLFSSEFIDETYILHSFLAENVSIFCASATFSPEVKKEIKNLFGEMKFFTLNEAEKEKKLPPIRQQAVILGTKREKFPLLLEQAAQKQLPRGTVIFANTRKETEEIFKELHKISDDKAQPVLLHGGLTEGQRKNAMKIFENGKASWLITTDVTARGLNLSKVTLILNYDLPHIIDAYIHRIGRTGRAGKRGESISFIAPEDRKTLLELERTLAQRIRAITPEQFSQEMKKLTK